MRLTFLRHFVGPTGGNFALRMLFRHAVSHPQWDVVIAFTPETRNAGAAFWGSGASDREVSLSDAFTTEMLVVNGKDWRHVPANYAGGVLHVVQHLGYTQDANLRDYLARPAFRICVSEEVRAAVAPHANGTCRVLENALEPAFFAPVPERRPGSVLVLGSKRPAFARRIADALPGAAVHTAWRPQADMIAAMRAHEICVVLPLAAEGFYLPALEAMACGCAVVCADVIGNRGHCISNRTCLQPAWSDAAGHIAAVGTLLDDSTLRTDLRRNGSVMAARHHPDAHRARTHAILDAILAARPVK